MAYRRIFEYPTTKLEDHAGIVHFVYLLMNVESSLRYNTAHQPYLCFWLCGKLGYTCTHYYYITHAESNFIAKAIKKLVCIARQCSSTCPIAPVLCAFASVLSVHVGQLIF